MRKHRKSATRSRTARVLLPVLNDNTGDDDPHDAIDRELLGIWMSISRLRHLLRNRAPVTSSGLVVALRRQAQPKKSLKSSSRKPRRDAA